MAHADGAAVLASYLTVSEAADFLGVSPWTLRNWDKAGKLKPLRHPKNGYRIYRHEDLRAILEPLTREGQSNWSDMPETDHIVQFYESDHFLIESAGGYLGSVLGAGDGAIVVVTPEHRDALHRELARRGIDASAAIRRGQLLLLDARETLNSFMTGSSIDRQRFSDAVHPALRRLKQAHRRVCTFGEMVAVLWREGNPQAAIELEELWDELRKQYSLTIFCAYPIDLFNGKEDAGFQSICKCHLRVLPTESFGSLLSSDDRLRAISRLQQKAQALEAEIEHREQVEASLRERESQYRKLVDEAELAATMKDQFLAILSHELRTPLSPVKMMLDAMQTDLGVPPHLRDDIAMMRRNISLETRLIDDILDLTRVSNGKLSVHKEDVEIHPIIRETAKMVAAEASDKNLAMDLDLTADCDGVHGDPARLQQVIWNLLRNAVKFTPERGRITIRTRSENNQLIITIQDNGMGIDSAVLPSIFNAFDQGRQGINQNFGGLGLGLAIARGIVVLHGGKISAHSDGPGLGATFTVELPCIEITPKAIIAAPTAPAKATSVALRILLVDDHADTLRVLRRLLEISGYQVRAAETVAQASAEMNANEFDLLISDIGLPDGTGLDVVKTLRARQPKARAIALTGFGLERDIETTESAGFDTHLTKPVSIDQLKAAISNLMQ